MKIVLLSTLALFMLAATGVAAQTKKKTKGMIDSHSFYHTPYRSRNSGAYDLGVRQLSLGFGVPNTLYNGYDYYSLSSGSNRSGFGPIMAKYEQAIRDEVGIGAIAEFAYRRWKYNVTNVRYTDKALGVGLSLLGYYHFNKFIPIRNLDVYAGVGINLNHVAYKDDFTGNTDGFVDVWPAGVAGARYLFTDQLGVYGELGRTNYSWFNLGVTIRL